MKKRIKAGMCWMFCVQIYRMCWNGFKVAELCGFFQEISLGCLCWFGFVCFCLVFCRCEVFFYFCPRVQDEMTDNALSLDRKKRKKKNVRRANCQ